MVRRMPTRASSIRRAAAIPVSSESWAFHSSTGSGARRSSVYAPSRNDDLLVRRVQAGAAALPLARDPRRADVACSSASSSGAVPSSIAACASS